MKKRDATALCHLVHIVRAQISVLAFVKTTSAKDLLGAKTAAVEVAVKAAAAPYLKKYVLIPNSVPTVMKITHAPL